MKDIDILYDIVKDEIVYQSPELYSFIELNRLWVNQFTLYLQSEKYSFYPNSHYFQDGELNPGYYEEVFSGSDIFLIKHLKRREFKSGENNLFQYVYDRKFLVIKDDIVYDVSSKNSFLKVYRSHKKDIRTFIRKNNLSFQEMSRNEIILLMDYCESFS